MCVIVDFQIHMEIVNLDCLYLMVHKISLSVARLHELCIIDKSVMDGI